MATTPSLRPLGVGEILGAGIKVYLRHWKPLMICVVAIVLPLQILSALVLSSVDPGALDYSFRTGGTSSSANATDSETAALLLVRLVSALGTLLAAAACLKAVGDAWLGGTPDAGRSLRFALRRLPSLVWLAIVAGCVLAVAFVALIVPGVWLFVAWSLAVPALLYERVGAFAALGRSFTLVRKRWWPMLGALLVGLLLAGVLGAAVQLIPSGIAELVAPDSTVAAAVAAVIGGTIGSMLSTPYTAAVIALLYFDQRVRKEGFDLDLPAEDVAAAEDRDVPARERQWWQDPVLRSPAAAGTYGGGYAGPAAEPPAGRAARREDESGSRDPDRADWLPPEAPRGPGGL